MGFAKEKPSFAEVCGRLRGRGQYISDHRRCVEDEINYQFKNAYIIRDTNILETSALQLPVAEATKTNSFHHPRKAKHRSRKHCGRVGGRPYNIFIHFHEIPYMQARVVDTGHRGMKSSNMGS